MDHWWDDDEFVWEGRITQVHVPLIPAKKRVPSNLFDRIHVRLRSGKSLELCVAANCLRIFEGLQGRDHERQGFDHDPKDATMSAKNATISAKNATINAKDANISPKDATMSAENATMITKDSTMSTKD